MTTGAVARLGLTPVTHDNQKRIVTSTVAEKSRFAFFNVLDIAPLDPRFLRALRLVEMTRVLPPPRIEISPCAALSRNDTGAVARLGLTPVTNNN